MKNGATFVRFFFFTWAFRALACRVEDNDPNITGFPRLPKMSGIRGQSGKVWKKSGNKKGVWKSLEIEKVSGNSLEITKLFRNCLKI